MCYIHTILFIFKFYQLYYFFYETGSTTRICTFIFTYLKYVLRIINDYKLIYILSIETNFKIILGND